MVKLNRHKGNWAYCLDEINKAGERPVTAKEGMQERIRQGIDAEISGGYSPPENFNYVQRRVLLALTDYNPLIPYAEQAVAANRHGEYFRLTDEIRLQGKPASKLLLEIAEQDAQKPVHERRVLDSKKKRTFTIPSKRLGEEEIAIFLARGEELAENYGDFLSNNADIKDVTFYLSLSGEQDFAAGFWLFGVGRGGRSYFNGYYRGLDDVGGCLFGVRKKSGEATSQKIMSYTERQTKQFLAILEGVRTGKLRASELEKVIKFFKRN